METRCITVGPLARVGYFPPMVLPAGRLMHQMIISVKAQVEILRRRLGGNRVILSPDDRAWLLALGQELNYDGVDMIGLILASGSCSLSCSARSSSCRRQLLRHDSVSAFDVLMTRAVATSPSKPITSSPSSPF